MRFNLIGLIAALWLFLGLLIVLFFLPQSLSGGWKPIILTIIFGPPIWVFVEWAGSAGIFVPELITTWRPVWRIAFFVVYLVIISLLLASVFQFFVRPLI